MFDNTLHIPLRFYDKVEKQDRYKDYITTRQFRQYTDIYHLPHFQVAVEYQSAYVGASIVNAATGEVTNIGLYQQGSDYLFVDYPVLQYTQFIYNGSCNLSSTLPLGDYYVKLVTSTVSNFATYEIHYSEVFTVADLTDKFTLQWKGINDIAGIDYTMGSNPEYSSNFIFDATLAKPEYVIEEEAVEDGDGNQMLTFQRSVKLFRFWFYGPEYIADALALVSLHDYVTFTTHYGTNASESGPIYDFAMTAEWQESKGLAKITCEFRDSPVIKTNCANNLA